MTELRPYGMGAPVHPPQLTDNCNWCQDGGIEYDTDYQICRVAEWQHALSFHGWHSWASLFSGDGAA